MASPSHNREGIPRPAQQPKYPSLFEDDPPRRSDLETESLIVTATKITLNNLDDESQKLIESIPDRLKEKNPYWNVKLSDRIKGYIGGQYEKIPIFKNEKELLIHEEFLQINEKGKMRLAKSIKWALKQLREVEPAASVQQTQNHLEPICVEEPSSPTDSEGSDSASPSSQPSPYSSPKQSPDLAPKKSPFSPPKTLAPLASPRPKITTSETTYLTEYEEHPDRSFA